MSKGLKIANLLRTPVYLGAKTVELGVSIFTPSHNFTFGHFVDFAHFFMKSADIGLEVITEAAVKGTNSYMRAMPFSEAMLAFYEHFTGVHALDLYTRVLKHGDIDALKMLLDRGVTRNQKLLDDILRTEQDEAARYLIEKGFADPKEVDFNKVLCYSASNPTARMTEYALENGAGINYKCRNTTLPIEEAVQQNSIPNVAALIKYGAELPPNIIISYATYDKFLESGMVQYLISQGVDPDYLENNFTAFSLTAGGRHYKLATYLLDTYNINVNIEHSGWTPLKETISACTYFYHPKDCSTALIRKILAHGAEVKYTGKGLNVLEMALKMSARLEEDSSDIIEVILCRGEYTVQEVISYMQEDMSVEARELLGDFIESDVYCSYKDWAGDNLLLIDSSLNYAKAQDDFN